MAPPDCIEHLQEHEIQVILAVLERDAVIQRLDEARTRKLRNSIRGERIPEKRLSVNCKTGEWMKEITQPARAPKQRGVEFVRNSIRRKRSSKPQRMGLLPAADETAGITSISESAAENRIITEKDESVKDTVVEATGGDFPQATLQNKTTEVKEEGKSKRRTSFRKKKTSPAKDKQVKFATRTDEKYVYASAEIDNKEIPAEETTKNVPQIIIDESVDVRIEKAESDKETEYSETGIVEGDAAVEKATNEVNVYSSNATFESLQNTIDRDTLNREDEKEEEPSETPKSEIPAVSSLSKGGKKIRVMKRKGSSRKKVSPKITDDSSRNELFSQAADKTTSETPAEYTKDVTSTAATTDISHKQVGNIEFYNDDNTEPSAVPTNLTEAPTTHKETGDSELYNHSTSEPYADPGLTDTTTEMGRLETYSGEMDNAKIGTVLDSYDMAKEIMASVGEPTDVQYDSPQLSQQPVIPNESNAVGEEKTGVVMSEHEKYSEDPVLAFPTVTGTLCKESVGEESYIQTPTISTESSEKTELFPQTKEVGYQESVPIEVNYKSTTSTHEEEEPDKSGKPDDEKLKYELSDIISTIADNTTEATFDNMKENKLDNATVDENTSNYDDASIKQQKVKSSIEEHKEELKTHHETYIATAPVDAITTDEKTLESPEKAVPTEPKDPSTEDKPKKKVIKKIVKKKVAKPAEEGADLVPKPENPTEEIDESGTSTTNASKLTRTQTVRKKVVKRRPPPKEPKE